MQLTPLTYIQKTMAQIPGSNFISDWKQLNEEDKETLKQWAAEEMKVLGI